LPRSRRNAEAFYRTIGPQGRIISAQAKYGQYLRETSSGN